ncbi:MAG TPA: molybdate ABC transporter substrate-binding protein [Devosia sp.]
MILLAGLRSFIAACLAGWFCSAAALAETASVAVAANFTQAAEQLAPAFKAQTGHDLVFSFGSTGQLFNQIAQGAPFEVFLAADDERPAKAVAEGFAVDGTVFTYAVGELALYSTSLDVSDGRAVLEKGAFDKLAIADPATAPYGAAALQTIEALGLAVDLTPKLVTGENITQTLQFVESGNAELGFVAASQVVGKASVWLVPAELHQPIRQDAVLLKSGERNPAAVAFLTFLKSEEARDLIRAADYSVGP